MPRPFRSVSGAGSAQDGVAQRALSEEQPVLKHQSESVPAAVRRQRMLAMITARDFVRVAELAEVFGVSDVTVRADLDSLGEAQSIRRVRGGAVGGARPVRRRRGDSHPYGDPSGPRHHVDPRLSGRLAAGVRSSRRVDGGNRAQRARFPPFHSSHDNPYSVFAARNARRDPAPANCRSRRFARPPVRMEDDGE